MKPPLEFEWVGPLDYTPTLSRELEVAGWQADRVRGEPTLWRDPLGLVGRMRTGEAWNLMMKRRQNGIGRKEGT